MLYMYMQGIYIYCILYCYFHQLFIVILPYACNTEEVAADGPPVELELETLIGAEAVTVVGPA